MRTYFLGDIHGNRAALEASLEHARQLGVDDIICLGDIVGWLPFGNETLPKIQSLNLPCVAGNHDWMVAGIFEDHPDQADRMEATRYNAHQLKAMPGALEFLAGLPLMLEHPQFVAVHHSPFHLPREGEKVHFSHFEYLSEDVLRGVLDRWAVFPHRLILSGHDHIPAVFELQGGDAAAAPPDVIVHRAPAAGSLTVCMKPQSRYWVKAGSVGGPYRDGIPLANSVLLDMTAATLTLYRIPYPAADLVRRLEAHPLCARLSTLQKYLELLKSHS